MSSKYKMTISRLTVDKLGVKLYDRVSAVIAELVANCYDADATNVQVEAPMDELLATQSGGALHDKGYHIEVRDDGLGMTPDEVNNFYLVVGAERRTDPRRGDTSLKFKRKVMGRKGVGKLAPFGVCQQIEIISSGGKRTKGKDEDGKERTGYVTAHLILDRSNILQDTDRVYHPAAGPLDGVIRTKHGTTIRLTGFDHRRVPSMENFERQLSQRFGLATANWQIELVDSLKGTSDPDRSRVVGEFVVPIMNNTEVRFGELVEGKKPRYRVVGPDGKEISDLRAGFDYEGSFYPVTGWVAYSKQPYRDDLMAGVRIYCRGKIAAQSHIFNLKAGFTGEYDIRSYLVGELHANWLDEDEDLIRTDRQDILWSHGLGQAFEQWGQSVVKRIGTITREPKRKRSWQTFLEITDFESRVRDAFPLEAQEEIRDNVLEIAKIIAQTTREEEFQDPHNMEPIVMLSLLLGPHITLDRKLREAAEENDDPLSVINSILKTARIAELSAFGHIADDRVKVIKRIESLKDDPATLESAFQNLLSEAPWLIDPQWSPIIANQAFSTLKAEFQKFYKEKAGDDLVLDPFSDPAKRMDFVLSSQDNVVQIIEIKKPKHALQNDEMGRINTYVELMEEFLQQPGNQEFRKIFSEFHVTLVCDKVALTGVHKTAFDGMKASETLTHITWTTFLLRTRKMHEAFLTEAERQKRVAANQ